MIQSWRAAQQSALGRERERLKEKHILQIPEGGEQESAWFLREPCTDPRVRLETGIALHFVRRAIVAGIKQSLATKRGKIHDPSEEKSVKEDAVIMSASARERRGGIGCWGKEHKKGARDSGDKRAGWIFSWSIHLEFSALSSWGKRPEKHTTLRTPSPLCAHIRPGFVQSREVIRSGLARFRGGVP